MLRSATIDNFQGEVAKVVILSNSKEQSRRSSRLPQDQQQNQRRM